VSATGSPPAPLFVREAGAGVPALLLHGLGGDHTVWGAQLGPLAERYRLLAPDLRGHGRSPNPEGSTLSFDELVVDLEGVLRAAGGEPAHLVGLSAGGFLALQYVLAHPEQVRSLTLMSTAAQCDGHTRAIAAHWAEVYRTQGYEPYVMRMLKDLFYPDWLDQHLEFIDHTLDAMRDRDLRAAVQWALAIRSFDVRPRLSRIRTPTLVAHGMEDRVIDASHARLLRQGIAGADLRLFPYAGHMLPIEKPVDTGRMLADWWSKVDAAGRAGDPARGP
jgi:3-oxoadipate enol-lactonase